MAHGVDRKYRIFSVFSKILQYFPTLFHTHMYLATQLEFHHDLWHDKKRIPG